MCYLAINTNIWLYLLKEGAESDNPLNALIHWIENQHVKILLPEIIITEWERHRDEKKNVLIQDWRDFLNRARKVFDSSYVNDLTPEFIEQQVDRQLDRVDYIFSNHAIVLPISEEVKLKSVENALHKKAPFHRKSSMADALILYSFLDYVKVQSLQNCFFITNKTDDFSEARKKSEIHSHLKNEFSNLGIRYYIDIKRVIHVLKQEFKLPDITNENAVKERKGEVQKISKAVSVPDSTRA